jgi:hypothetical protein
MTAPAFDTDGMLASTIQGKLQYMRMRSAMFRDQHGRQWACEISTETLHPCTPLMPVNFRAPHPMLVPPAKYLQVSNVFGEIVIDYDGWLIDVANARREYDAWVMEAARHLYKGAALDMIRAGDPDLIKFCGPAPMSPEFVRAMKSGVSKWVLGLLPTSSPIPAWAQKEMHTLTVIETWDGSDVETGLIDAEKYRDDDVIDEDADERAERLAAAARYGDIEDDADPSASPDFQPLPRKRGRPPKER